VRLVDEEIAREIGQRRRALDLEEREDILSLLLVARNEGGSGLSDLEVRDELATLLVAGHETTASAIAWAVRELAGAPELQDELAEEGSGELLEATITETLRLHPPAPIVLRKLLRPARIAGHDLAAGTTLAPCMLLVHRRADLYPDPWRFDPKRFIGRRPVASEWFPFGGSTRRCIGAAFAQFEARVVLEELTRALSFRPDRLRAERPGRRGPILVPGRGAMVLVKVR
jgi:cytochrome P450